MKSVITATLLSLLPALLLSGQETSYVVSPTNVSVTLEKKGAVLSPATGHALQLNYQTWGEFRIKELAKHGTKVAKGEQLLAFDRSKLDREILKVDTKLKKITLAIAKTKQSISNVERSKKLRLEAGHQTLDSAKEDLAYYKSSLEPLERKKAAKAIVDSEKALKYSQAEYNQLKKMYSEDQVTEETEEIILERQKDRLRHREFYVNETKVRTKQKLDHQIPRELHRLKAEYDVARLAYKKLEIDIPAELADLNFELESLKLAKNSTSRLLKKMHADREAMVITSPAAGTLYYGTFTKGAWDTKISASLRVGHSLLNGSQWGTLVTSSGLVLSIPVSERDAALITAGNQAYGTLKSIPGRHLQLTVSSVSSIPITTGKFLVTFDVKAAPEITIFPGQQVDISMTLRTLNEALLIPEDFIHKDKQSNLRPFVWLKAAQGVSKHYIVPGYSTDKGIQVLNGLTAGSTLLKTKAKVQEIP